MTRRLGQLILIPTALALLTANLLSKDEDSGIDRGLNLLREGDESPRVAVGDRLSSFVLRDVHGKSVSLKSALGRGPVAIVFLSSSCPLAKRYVERLKALDTEYGARGVALIAVFPNVDETLDGVRGYAKKAGFAFPVVKDVHGYAARRLGATMTPQVFLLDQESVLVYRGAIDDHRYENRVRRRYLAEAIDATLAKGKVAQSSTNAIGCRTHLPEDPAPKTDEEVVYTTHIARILQDNCQSCHREGQVGPFALTDYSEAKRWRREIRSYTKARLMPPWKAKRGFGHFRNDMSLSDREISLIERWVAAGAPEGPKADLPPAPEFSKGWAYGEPDLVFEMPEEYVVGPEGEDDYRHFVIPYELAEHRFIEAVDVQPGNRSTVHHVLAYVDRSGKARELDAADPGPGYSRFGGVGFKPASAIGGWAPGNLPVKMRPGTGRWLPKKGDVVIQVHYYRTGFEERDRTKIGLYFSKAKRPVPSRSVVAVNRKFEIPAGARRHVVRASRKIEEDIYAYSVTPHMHLLGETIEVTAKLPSGKTIPLVRLEDWDFNWQTSYHFRDLIRLPTGTEIQVVGTFDNSTENPNNPNDPPTVVSWGEKTTDEMCLAFVGYYRLAEFEERRIARAGQPTHETGTALVKASP